MGVSIPLTGNISCLGLVRETQRMYQLCFLDMLSSEIVSSVSIAPLVVSESRIFWWTSVSFCIYDTYTAPSHQVLPGL